LTRDTILAFQRHWLPNQLTGKFDVETVWRMESVLRASE
jgi:N-acetyl-anhydromuramyl-L-alanine amidase AmpD